MGVHIAVKENVWPSTFFVSDIYASKGCLTKENICWFPLSRANGKKRDLLNLALQEHDLKLEIEEICTWTTTLRLWPTFISDQWDLNFRQFFLEKTQCLMGKLKNYTSVKLVMHKIRISPLNCCLFIFLTSV